MLNLTAARAEKYPVLCKTIELVAEQMSFFESSIAVTAERFGVLFWEKGEAHCRLLMKLCMERNIPYDKAVKSYVRISLEYLHLQQKLLSTGKYYHSDYSVVREAVYDNPEIMEGYYLDGIFLTLIFWPNHFEMLRFFETEFLSLLPSAGTGCEIATGHGVFFKAFCEGRKAWDLVGVDISDSSLRYTHRVLRAGAVDVHSLHLLKGDVTARLPFREQCFDAVVCGELMEHLEDPRQSLIEMNRIMKKDGYLFLTAAVFAANIDHIYLFESAAEVRCLVQKAGLIIVEERKLAVNPEDSPDACRIPLNYCCIAQKRTT